MSFKSNRDLATDNKITAILAWLREGPADIYTQNEINQIKDYDNTQDWGEFIKEIKTAFSNKIEIIDAEQKIEIFQQGKKHIIEEECQEYYLDNTRVFTYSSTRIT